ncbi:MAG: ABC transporter substrate-binding protein [Deltaproteobacteria bacterium]|nr:MAG: ABC transporter substrate-binding protein [Deltaproteobacteria bacterium]
MKTLTALCLLAVLSGGCKKSEDSSANKKPVESAKSSASSPTPSKPEPVEIKISCGSVGQDYDVCKQGVDAWAQKTGNKVTVVTSPTSSSEKLAQAQQLLGAGASDIDVFSVDVVWPGILGAFFLDLKQYSKGAENEHFPPLVANGTLDGKLVAMPWYTDAGLLYYRKDLLEKYKEEVPTTWAQLAATAKKIAEAERKAGNKKMQGFVFQGKAYEGLTCNALEWITSFGGGTIVEPDGKISIDNPKAVAAIELAASWPGTISPVGVLNFEEEEARTAFQAGDAVFMRNWPYAWGTAQKPESPIKDKVGIVPLPKGDGEGARPAATLGGWDLAVSKFSKHPAEAADLVLYLTGAAEQKRRAIVASFQPTLPALYTDKEILEKNPFFASLADVFKNAVPRPSTVTGGKYNQVSSAFWNAVHAVMAKQKSAKDSLSELAGALDRIKGPKW